MSCLNNIKVSLKLLTLSTVETNPLMHLSLVHALSPQMHEETRRLWMINAQRSRLIHPMRARLLWRYAAGPIGVIRTNGLCDNCLYR